MTRKKRRPRLGKTGCLFWLFIILVIIVFILYRGKGSFKNTFSFLKNRVSTEEFFKTSKDEKGFTSPEEQAPVIAENDTEERTPSSPEDEIARETSQQEKEESAPTTSTKTGGEKVEPEQKERQTEVLRTKNLRVPLYYVKLNRDEGSAKVQPVIRTVQYKDSPITRTIESLLGGPTQKEKELGLVSFIPEGTDLLGARIDSGHLTLNFSDQFENNYSGREAILFQLSQVMLTSFEFGQVTSLSILINGRKKQYITGEGIPLKEVYTKKDLTLLNSEG
jgi:spore germination protein GerM